MQSKILRNANLESKIYLCLSSQYIDISWLFIRKKTIYIAYTGINPVLLPHVIILFFYFSSVWILNSISVWILMP